MLKDSAYLGKPVKNSSTKRLPLKYIVRDSDDVSKQRKDFEKPNIRMECSTENTVGKASFSLVQNSNQPSSYSPFSGHAITNDSSMILWCFHQPSGHQWLIPVMYPSEGLVYKLYPGPGVMRSVCGGYGPPRSTPTVKNLSAPAYGVPASHHHYQGLGTPFVPPAGHAYFPPNGMPVINPAISSSANSSDVPRNKNGTIPDVKSCAYRDAEILARTASSLRSRAHRVVMDHAAEGRNVLPQFPTSPAIDNPDSSPQPHVPSHPAGVIKVVPRNARSYRVCCSDFSVYTKREKTI
ncbi:protein early flowering 3 [Nicotiana attenuata]|uniref:Protein early flowering 3 n=1 Tax=Nicotiana attenuata TaxID=49451 RepID=A0A314KUF8_NICAT|nr:protein early flowering 3 [Nicotiana attenuata]